MRLYFDVCCLNRPFDDQTQDRIHLEAEAVITILRRVETGDWRWLNSSVVLFEIHQTPNPERKNRLLTLCEAASEIIRLDDAMYALAERLKGVGFTSYDALHVACAQHAGVDIMLSTDHKVIKRAAHAGNLVTIRVENPWVWLQEVL